MPVIEWEDIKQQHGHVVHLHGGGNRKGEDGGRHDGQGYLRPEAEPAKASADGSKAEAKLSLDSPKPQVELSTVYLRV